jgi:hypothetical protein
VKRCCDCTLSKQLEEFYLDRSNKTDRRQGRCKSCTKVRNKAYRETNPLYSAQKSREWYEAKIKENPDYNRETYQKERDARIAADRVFRTSPKGAIRRLFYAAQHRALDKGREFDLTVEWIDELYQSQDGRCALTGLSFDLQSPLGHKQGTYRPMSPSLDRIDSTKGYTSDNVRLVLTCLNIALNHFGEDVVEPVFKAFLEKKGYVVQKN